ncbi:MAG: RNA polymerase sigma factor [Blastocatellia bacterium]
MADSPGFNPKDPQNMNSEMFARFLECLAPDTEEAGRRYTRLHKKLTGFFRLKGISDPESAANETIDRAILKIAAGAGVPDADKYCLGIARNIAKERYRRVYREDLALHKFIQDLSHSSVEQVERIYGILKPCFEQLATDDQQLLLAYCKDIQGRARAQHRRELAEARNISVLALRIRVTRLRNSLTECVRRRSREFQTSNPDM